ncbi:MAG: glycoside hydrolase family 97 protein [Mucilaginibacter polytrichastri]|nr:glycoside hydrolase family 97 protein [Mucilaginibacter polytrichastri]
MKKYLLLFAALISAHAVFAQKNLALRSPDGQIRFHFRLTKNAPEYAVDFRDKPLLDFSSLGLVFKGGDHFDADLRPGKVRSTKHDGYYDLAVGKASHIRDQYRELRIPLTDRKNRTIDLVVRAYNDALAFRYEFPKQANWTNYILTDEHSTFRFSGDPEALTLFRENYITSHEGLYSRLPLSRIKADTLMDMPTLFHAADAYVAITEAALRDYAGMYLVKKNGVLSSTLSPLPDQKEEKVKAVLPHKTPWRVLMIAGEPGKLLESNILTSLNEPTKMRDLSWLNPGKTTFHWWNGDILPDTTFSPGANFNFNKYYIDFCARNRITYHSVIGYGEFAWYQNDGPGYQPGPHTDILKTAPAINMQEICDYAKSKGVKIRVWVHWQALYPKLDSAFAQFEKWGVKGMMIDFMDRDDQEMVNMQEEMLKKAADHHLHIQFHGSFKPTGLHRTYPNEFTREGTLNYENNKWGPPMTPEHDLDIAFTRLLAGSSDYHLGGFRAVPPKDFKIQYTRPLMIGTRSHMLAMYVVLESYLGMLCDYPQAYEGEAGFDWLREVPVTWDETHVPAAEPGKFMSIARRKGDTWYIGTINNSEQRSIELKTDFLPKGRYAIETWSDPDDAAAFPNKVKQEERQLNAGETMRIRMAAGGGNAIRIKKTG